MTVIDDYLKDIKSPERTQLEHIRKLVHEVAPGAEEVITYGLPGFKYQKKYLVAFAAFKDHLSIFPGAHAIEALEDKLTDFKTSRGTVQFTLEQPLSDDVVRSLVRIRKDDIDEAKK